MSMKKKEVNQETILKPEQKSEKEPDESTIRELISKLEQAINYSIEKGLKDTAERLFLHVWHLRIFLAKGQEEKIKEITENFSKLNLNPEKLSPPQKKEEIQPNLSANELHMLEKCLNISCIR